MQNRRERSLLEKMSGMRKIEKNMTLAERESLKKRKIEYVKQAVLLKAQEQENARIDREAEDWSRNLEQLMADGTSREIAEGILKNNRELQERRKQKLAEKNKHRTA